jgi:hypothetical protein
MEICKHAYPPFKHLNEEHSVSCWLYATEAQKQQAAEEAKA